MSKLCYTDRLYRISIGFLGYLKNMSVTHTISDNSAQGFHSVAAKKDFGSKLTQKPFHTVGNNRNNLMTSIRSVHYTALSQSTT